MARANRYKRPKEVMKIQKGPLGSNAQGPISLEGVRFLSYYNLVCRCVVVLCDAYDVYSTVGSGELQRGAVGVVCSNESTYMLRQNQTQCTQGEIRLSNIEWYVHTRHPDSDFFLFPVHHIRSHLRHRLVSDIRVLR